MKYQLIYNQNPEKSPDDITGEVYRETFISERKANFKADALNVEIDGPGRWIAVEVGR